MLVSTLSCRALRPRLSSSPFRPFSPAFRQLSQTPIRSFPRQGAPISGQAVVPPTPTPPPFPPPPPPPNAATDEASSFLHKVGKPRVGRVIMFVGVTSFLMYTVAAAQTSIETEYWVDRLQAQSAIWSVKTIKNEDLHRARNVDLLQSLQRALKTVNETTTALPMYIRQWANFLTFSVLQPYADASEGKRLCWRLVLLNAAVYVAWKIPSWERFMARHFMHNPLSGLSYTLITSTFSHRTFWHLLLNCLALESFGSAAYFYLLKSQNKEDPDTLEATQTYHFLSFFVTAGMVSGLVSHLVNTKFRYPRLVAQLALPSTTALRTETWASAVAASARPAAAAAASTTSKAKVLDIVPSLGASGAIWATVTVTALAFPESQVALFIPPTYPINIQTGVCGLIALDMIGIWRGWRFFDHWAHLGGAAFGALYFAYGPTYWKFWRQEADEAGEQVRKEEAGRS